MKIWGFGKRCYLSSVDAGHFLCETTTEARNATYTGTKASIADQLAHIFMYFHNSKFFGALLL